MANLSHIKDEPYSWQVVHAFFYALALTYLVFTLWYWIHAKWQNRISKNKLTL
jgi:hypothetical protein